MSAIYLIKKILRRPFFYGQDRLFNFFFSRNKLNNGNVLVKPITGNFKILCDTKTWIGAKIAYTGDYEAPLKSIFKEHLKKGHVVLDVGANVGFHTLYFADLVGEDGKVFSFEPVKHNFASLTNNININNFKNINSYQLALSNKNEEFNIDIDENSINPGSFNLFDRSGDLVVK